MRLAAVPLLVLLIGAAAGAQAPAGGTAARPGRISVTTIQLKPDMASRWDDIVRAEVVPALKKAGIPWQQVWANGAFGQEFTRVVLRPIVRYGQFDGPDAYQAALGAEAATRLKTRLQDTIVQSRTMAMTLRRELTIESGTSTPPSLLHVSFRQTYPGKAAEFVSVMAADFLPNFRKTGIKDYWVYQSSFGAPNGLFMIVRPIAGYAALEEPSMMSQTLGGDASAPAYGRFNPLQSGTEFDVFAVVPELGFGIPVAARASN
jgi:hypothetical protein